ncbi:hypothetical protein SJA_C1-26070 [Sphingobium indicum UT26S]|uniref:Uncharacterized protein n=1 Tax=Sphingobium indicum (strain DSM 16413 / CCM 7287 / MTCC 6362 / UT26 / NBRC 101211 / UT26S) TaxID=452662 RepID=D4Z4A9_SPHIU|nr:hypothetical protein SJA_C1-26070 [Sphingobium indicum UT26S]
MQPRPDHSRPIFEARHRHCLKGLVIGECVVQDAVWSEPVSSLHFPDIGRDDILRRNQHRQCREKGGKQAYSLANSLELAAGKISGDYREFGRRTIRSS